MVKQVGSRYISFYGIAYKVLMTVVWILIAIGYGLMWASAVGYGV